MLLVLSPAKNLSEESIEVEKYPFSTPEFMEEARVLVKEARKLSPIKLAELMSVSESIAQLNYKRFEEWYAPFTPKNAKQAIFCFNGDVYQGLQANTFNEEDLGFAQNHIRILSGLYGILKPLDLMQPYRLEMGLSFETENGKNLYQFWDTKLAKKLNEHLAEQGADVLVNLASNEYFKAVPKKALKAKIISPAFKDSKEGSDYKVISFYAKKARGLMANFIVKNKITKPDDLKAFDAEGYYFNQDLTKDELSPVFTRNH
jgi:cytoplasmic iron level regulating protein YaaA (DUF328/UPF0246 family)